MDFAKKASAFTDNSGKTAALDVVATLDFLDVEKQAYFLADTQHAQLTQQFFDTYLDAINYVFHVYGNDVVLACYRSNELLICKRPALTLEQFRATRKLVENFEGAFRENITAYVYASNCWIGINSENCLYDDASYTLTLYNEEYISADLAQLEKKLYTQWYLRECC